MKKVPSRILDQSDTPQKKANDYSKESHYKYIDLNSISSRLNTQTQHFY